MARRVNEITITEAGRDQGLTFRITEMPARAAEKWATRLLLAFFRNGIIDENVLGSGWGGLMQVGANAVVRGIGVVDFRGEIEPLLDEMLTCIEFVPDPRRPEIPARTLLAEEPEEVTTLVRLRTEWVALHMGFSSASALWTFMTEKNSEADQRLKTMSTSPLSSAE